MPCEPSEFSPHGILFYCGNCGQSLDWSKLDDAEEEFIGWDGVEDDD